MGGHEEGGDAKLKEDDGGAKLRIHDIRREGVKGGGGKVIDEKARVQTGENITMVERLNIESII